MSVYSEKKKSTVSGSTWSLECFATLYLSDKITNMFPFDFDLVK